MSLNRIIVIALSFSLFAVSCKKYKQDKKRITVTNGDADNRLTVLDEEVEIADEDSSGSRAILKKPKFTRKGRLKPPTAAESSSIKLKASHVYIHGDYAYVSYNVEGEEFEGGVDIIDISDITSPSLVSSITFDDTDVSALYYDDASGNLYIAAATEDEGYDTPAMLEELEIESNAFSGATRNKDVGSYVATDVKVIDDKVFVTTGDNGGLEVRNTSNLNVSDEFALTDARAIAFNSTKIAVLLGQPATLKIYNRSTLALENTYVVGGATIAESKSNLYMDDTYAIVAAGDGGTRVVRLSDGNVMVTEEVPTVSGQDASDLVTNSVAFEDDYLYMANGEGGVYLAELSSDKSEITALGNMSYKNKKSANYVYVSDGVIFIARGEDGFEIYKYE